MWVACSCILDFGFRVKRVLQTFNMLIVSLMPRHYIYLVICCSSNLLHTSDCCPILQGIRGKMRTVFSPKATKSPMLSPSRFTFCLLHLDFAGRAGTLNDSDGLWSRREASRPSRNIASLICSTVYGSKCTRESSWAELSSKLEAPTILDRDVHRWQWKCGHLTYSFIEFQFALFRFWEMRERILLFGEKRILRLNINYKFPFCDDTPL